MIGKGGRVQACYVGFLEVINMWIFPGLRLCSVDDLATFSNLAILIPYLLYFPDYS